MVVTLRDVVSALDDAYPRHLAEDWDAVGLVCGDVEAPVASVRLTVDVTEAVVDEALAAGADLLVAHHPLLLHAVHGVGTDTAKGRLLHRLISGGCALFTAHTNADIEAPGVSDALARTIGLTGLVPLDARPQDGADPSDPGPRGLGRVGTLPQPMGLQAFAEHVSRVLPRTNGGIRIAGPVHAQVERVAVCGGSGDSLIGAARTSGADVFVTADLRHHPVSDALEVGGPWLVDVPHWASEWPWLMGARERILASLDPLGEHLGVVVSRTVTDPWTSRA